MDDKVKEKLQKLLRLAKTGGHEGDTAQQMLERLLAKHGGRYEDIMESEERKPVEFYFYEELYRTLLINIVCMVQKANSCSTYTKPYSKKKFYIWLNPMEELEVKALYEQYSKALSKDLQLYVLAFLSKNHIDSGVPSDEEDNSPPFTDEELEALAAMMGGATKVEVRKRLT